MASARIMAVWLAGVALLPACSSWSPPVFSPALSSSESCAAPASAAAPAADTERAVGANAASLRLQAAITDTELARKRYIHAARCLTQDGNLSGAALIGLSSLALFKGVTAPNAKDLAGLGVLGGATYLYGSGAEGALGQRRLVYYAGADALSCALKAAEPYRQPATSALTGSPTSLEALSGKALQTRQDLAAPERDLRTEAARRSTSVQRGRRPDAGCAQINPEQCRDPGRAADVGVGERAHFEACSAKHSRCAATPGRTVRLALPPQVTTTLADIAKARDDIDKLLGDAADLQANIDMTAMLLTEQSAHIQLQVAREVDKTYPDLAAVLNSGSGLKTIAFKVSGASAFGDPAAAAGTLQSDRPGAAPQFAPDVPLAAAQAEAQSRLTAAIAAAADLRHALRLVKRRGEIANTDLRSCALGPLATAATPTVAPAENGAPNAEAQPAAATVVTLDHTQTLAPLLGLSPTASGREVQQAAQACEQKVLGRPNATGVTLDPQAMQALLERRCLKLPQ